MNFNQQQKVSFNNKILDKGIRYDPSLSKSKVNRVNSDELYNKSMKPRKKRILFTKEEDSQIEKAIEQYGEHNWRIIASFLPGRTQRQCRERWTKFLSPNINQSSWTAEEDELLLKKFNEYGPKWSYISRFFNNRTDVNLKSRYAIHVRKMKREQEFLSHYTLISKDAITLNVSSIEKLLSRKEKSAIDNETKFDKLMQEIENKTTVDDCFKNTVENSIFDINFEENEKSNDWFDLENFDSTVMNFQSYEYFF